MAVTAERFAQGMTFAEYMAQMREKQEAFAANYAEATIPEAARAVVCDLDTRLNVLVLTEDWCGDARTYVPVLGRLAECGPGWNVRIFYRDANLDLADQYLNQGKWRSVPVVVFFDEQMRELGHFIERPAQANAERQAVIDRVAAEHPAVQAGRSYNDQTDAARALLAEPLRDLYRERKAAWQAAAIDEVVAVLRPRRAAA